jgi:haloalkane dehalogenase
MTVLRTPDDRFENLPGFPFEPHYTEIVDADLGRLRIHYIDEGPAHGPVVLCLHGEPTWSYLYRKMIPIFADAGFRTLAPDLVGFGRSDKPSERSDYTYAKHVRWMTDWLVSMGLCDVTLLGQDWGGLIGLRMVAELPERFARFSLSNTALPTGDHAINKAFHRWRAARKTRGSTRATSSTCSTAGTWPRARPTPIARRSRPRITKQARASFRCWCPPGPTTRPCRRTGQPGRS